MLDPRNTDPTEFIKQALTHNLSERQARRLFGSVIGNGECAPQVWAEKGILSLKLAQKFPLLSRLSLEQHLTSPKDGFQKLLFRTHDGLAVETVILPLHKEKTASICLSSQVGCVMGCVFCATARMTNRRNLETWEIIDQFLQARALVAKAGTKVTGAVFMGMGEPFLNYDNVLSAAEILRFPVLNAITGKAITISTVGIVNKIDRFREEQRVFRLSISLGAALDEKRARLVPVAAKIPVAEVMAAARRYALERKTRVMLAYVCIQGENVSEEDARALSELIGDTPVRLDLIEVTDPTKRFLPPTDLEMQKFRDALTKYLRQPVARRYSGGADINAACGTLAGV